MFAPAANPAETVTNRMPLYRKMPTADPVVEMCYMSLEPSETALKKTIDFNCEP